MAAAVPESERKRVKVYELKDNDWSDRGTGFCAAQLIKDQGRIVVESEEEPEHTLLEIEVRKDEVYQKQQDTLIVWTDDKGVDMALSFQEAEGCCSIWYGGPKIKCSFKKQNAKIVPSKAISLVQQRSGDDDAEEMLPPPLVLPTAELGNLPQIEEAMRRAAQTRIGQDSMSKMIMQDNYISSLTSLVEMAEDLEALPELHHLCNIMKTLILFNDTQIIEHVVRDELILGVVGALEYDPDFPHHKANHRQYLSDETKFKEVVPIEDPEIRGKIHFTYRLQYLKDVVLARILDDPTFSVLNSLIFFHQVDIVQHIQGNAAYLKEVFSLLSSAEAPAQKKKDAVLLIQQSCAIAKNLQAPARVSLYQNLIQYGLFNTITFALQHHDAAVRVAGTDILVAVIDHDAVMMRNHIIKAIQEKTKPMTETLIDLLLAETDLGVKAQIADAIKVLLDPNPALTPDRPLGGEANFIVKMRNIPNNAQQNENFLDHFYKHSAHVLFKPLLALEGRTNFNDLTVHEITTFSHLVEILCFFLRSHNYRAKFYVLEQGLHARIVQLLSCPEKYVILTAVKYFRTVIATADEYHFRQLQQHHIFAQLLRIISPKSDGSQIQISPRDNLLNSAVLELFEFIRRENIPQCIVHLVETQRDLMESITHVDVFRGIFLRYEQHFNPALVNSQQNSQLQGEGEGESFMTSEADTPNTRHVTINGGALRWGEGLRGQDEEEEAYFNTSDDDDDEGRGDGGEIDDETDELTRDHQTHASSIMNGLAASPIGRPLVDYDDDDDADEEDEMRLPSSTRNASKLQHTSEHSSSPNSPANSPSPAISSSTLPSSTSPQPAGTQSRNSSALLRQPPAKRLREEDDDDDEDEIGKLSSGIKRRHSAASLRTTSASHLNSSLQQRMNVQRKSTNGQAQPNAAPSSSSDAPSLQAGSNAGSQSDVEADKTSSSGLSVPAPPALPSSGSAEQDQSPTKAQQPVRAGLRQRARPSTQTQAPATTNETNDSGSLTNPEVNADQVGVEAQTNPDESSPAISAKDKTGPGQKRRISIALGGAGTGSKGKKDPGGKDMT